jgi:uncharacterized phage-associated protein
MKAMDVARTLIWAAEAEEEPDRLTNMRLQKLLYYVQAWSMVNRGQPIFNEKIEAWTHGPVVRDVFDRLKHHGSNTIDPNEAGAYEHPPSQDDEQFIRSVWEAYRDYSTTSLREMTHNEDPWKHARNGSEPTVACDHEITVDSLKSYFSNAA